MTDLHGELDEIDRALAGPARRLANHLNSDEGQRTLGLIWGATQADRSTASALRAGARAFGTLLDLHPAGDGPRLSRIGVTLAGDAARDAGRIVAFGSLYLDSAGPRYDRVWDIAIGADVVNRILRHAILGRPIVLRPRVPPDLYDYVRDFVERHCVAGVHSAALGLQQALRGVDVGSDAAGITALDPPSGCAGRPVTVRGSGFGSTRPRGVEVYFPTRGGGCRRAEVVAGGWTDTAITVVAPPDVGSGCVGFVRDRSTGTTLTSAVSSFVGEVTSCFGPLFAEPIRVLWGRVTETAFRAPCPPCLPGDANRFAGGPPEIGSFLARRIRDGVDHLGGSADLHPLDMLELRWSVSNATTVDIRPVAVGLHELPAPAGPLPSSGQQLLRWDGNPLATGTFAWDAAYELRATNDCGTTTATVPVRMRLPRRDRPAPGEFLWGVATAGRQVEGDLTGDDWHVFTTDPKILKRLADLRNLAGLEISPQTAGTALRHWAWGEFVRSVERAAALGLNAYRFSIEWSRIEPAPGHFDATALGNYQMMVAAVRAHGMEPVVVLNHMSLPAWVQTPPRETVNTCLVAPGGSAGDPGFLASLRGWEEPQTVAAYVTYVRYVVSRLTGVEWWITLNEPLGTTVLTGYVASVFPPGFLGDEARARTAVHHLIEAHARAYEAIHAIDADARVGITDQWLACKSDVNASTTRKFAYYNQDLLINALVHGDEDRDISVDAPRYERVLGIDPADWRPHVDFFGLQYYKAVYPYPYTGAPSWLGRVDLNLSTASHPHALLNDMGWEVYPAGLYDSLMKLRALAPDLPILVAENGTAEVVDRNRGPYVVAHLREMERARADGSPVVGYLHWSISDNWEWIDGYRPQARFGLYSVPLPATDPVHSITDGALALAQAVTSVDDARRGHGAYSADGRSVEHPTMSPNSTWHGTLDGRPITLVLSALGPPPANPLPRRRDLTGMLFHADERRGVHLDEVVWETATRTLQFWYRGYAVGGTPLPERIFSGVLDPTGARFTGSAGTLPWAVTRAPFAGVWQGHLTPTSLISLSLSCPERVWRGRILMVQDWFALDSLVVTEPLDFRATHGGNLVVGVYSSLLGEIAISPYNKSLKRLPDALPF